MNALLDNGKRPMEVADEHPKHFATIMRNERSMEKYARYDRRRKWIGQVILQAFMRRVSIVEETVFTACPRNGIVRPRNRIQLAIREEFSDYGDHYKEGGGNYTHENSGNQD